ncbi:CoA transferase [Streptomyces rapamycinicus]|uniref:CoA transferase n=1 Tax=Streptomyces rapamycinicus TaxID=1226757 RepID=UPI001AD81B94|nr:CoA transferase [Streptomyces rapamycinicus]
MPDRGGYARTASPHRRPCRTKDGYLAVMIYTDNQWRAFFECIGRPELAEEPKYRTIRERTVHIDELYQLLNAEMTTRTTAEWQAELERRDIPAARVNSVTDLFADPHLRATDFFEHVDHPSEGPLRLPRQPVNFGPDPVRRTDGAKPLHAPRLGEHSLEVAREIGLGDAEIERLVASGTLGVPRAGGTTARSGSSTRTAATAAEQH